MLVEIQGGINLALNASPSHWSKHTVVHFHYIRNSLEDGTIILQDCPTDNKLADVMTKVLCRLKFEKLVGELGLETAQDFVKTVTKGSYVSSTGQEDYYVSNSNLFAVTGRGWS